MPSMLEFKPFFFWSLELVKVLFAHNSHYIVLPGDHIDGNAYSGDLFAEVNSEHWECIVVREGVC